MTGATPGPATGERVLVTGAASGLGAALAAAWEARGARVLRTDRVSAVSTTGGGSTTGHVLRLDVTSDDDWAAALDHVEATWGGLDVLVNNAGVAGGGRLDVAPIDEWRWITEINLFGAVRGTRTFTPLLKRQGSGRIVNIASLAGLVHPAGMASYNATKAAVVALTETTGHELAAFGVTAHAVCPSYFRTSLVDSLRDSPAEDAALTGVVAHLVESSPFSADDIAAAVLEALDRGEELILPDQPARDAYALKQADRAAYDVVMRRQAAKLHRMAGADLPPDPDRADPTKETR
ncbi:SDR family NAD(P)-dependent oxidoreductase [Nocardioides ferulae]|uniref:SDR family NAD(P)-dependent oxidoreductase n=1 Tax=Nocardioides ferulae TaxID=2340821 RepID=UPI000EAC38CC|nr:SDR family NAD(P)-dependent oxidoreductase [Nocardioides ferulae]